MAFYLSQLQRQFGVISMSRISNILEKAANIERITIEQAILLYRDASLMELGFLARKIMLHNNPNRIITFVIDRNINYTNICDTKCKFCAFYKSPEDTEGYVLTYEEIYKKIEETIALGGTQILMQGGTHPSLPFDFYTNLIKGIKSNYNVNVHSFSPPEIYHFSKISNQSIKDVILGLKNAGLDSIPGGGAEILVDRVRAKVSPNKITASQWLEVMETAHNLGLKSTATMVYGLGETFEERLEHLEKIRSLQDKTNGFTAFIPWSFQPTNTELGGGSTGGVEYLKTLAIARIFLDNVKNIQVSWVTQGGKMAQLALYFGGNDFGGTMLEENVVRAAGTQNKVPIDDIIKYIKDVEFTPAQRTTQYQIIKTY